MEVDEPSPLSPQLLGLLGLPAVPSALGVRACVCGFPGEGPMSPAAAAAAAAAKVPGGAESSSVIEEVMLDEPLFATRPEGAARADSDADWITSFVMYVSVFVWG